VHLFFQGIFQLYAKKRFASGIIMAPWKALHESSHQALPESFAYLLPAKRVWPGKTASLFLLSNLRTCNIQEVLLGGGLSDDQALA